MASTDPALSPLDLRLAAKLDRQVLAMVIPPLVLGMTLTGARTGFLFLVLILLFPGLLASRGTRPPGYYRVWSVISGLFVMVSLALFGLGEQNGAQTLLHTSAFLILYRCFTPRSRRHYLQLWILSSFVVLIGGMAGNAPASWAIGLFWVLAGLTLLYRLSLIRFRDEAQGAYSFARGSRLPGSPWEFFRSIRLTWASAIAFTTLIFVLIPRNSGRVPAFHLRSPETSGERRLRETGLSDSVDFRSMGDIRERRDVVMGVLPPAAGLGLPNPRFRLGVLDDFDGAVWKKRDPLDTPPPTRLSRRPVGSSLLYNPDTNISVIAADSGTSEGNIVSYRLRLENLPAGILPTLPGMIGAAGPDNVNVYEAVDGRLLYDGPAMEELYIYSSWDLPGDAPGAVYPWHLEIPEGLSRDSMREIMQQARLQGQPSLDFARQLEVYLRQNGRYSFQFDNQLEGKDAVNAFLSGELEGHCELFATAMALILREQGVPARLVTGFLGGTYEPSKDSDRPAEFIVRSHHAHTWVEAHFEGRGWIAFDSTPWSDSILGEVPDSRDSPGGIAMVLHTFFTDFGRDSQRYLRRSVAAVGTMLVAKKDRAAFSRAMERLWVNLREPPMVILAVVLVLFNVAAVYLLRWWRRAPLARRLVLHSARTPAGQVDDGMLLELVLRMFDPEAGRGMAPATTAAEQLRDVIRHKGLGDEWAGDLIEAFHRARFGPEHTRPEERRRLVQLVDRMIASVPAPAHR